MVIDREYRLGDHPSRRFSREVVIHTEKEEISVAIPAVYLLVEFTIHDGKLDAFKGLAKEMTSGSQVEPGILEYEWYFSSDGKRCRLVESYATADTLLAHFNGPVVQQLVPKLVELVTVDSFEVYGDPGPQVAAMLVGFGAEIFQHWQGLDR